MEDIPNKLETDLEQIGLDESVLIEMAYVAQGTTGEVKEWAEMSEQEKKSYLVMYLYVKDRVGEKIEDADGAITKQLKQARNANHGFMGLTFMNPGAKEKVLLHSFADRVDYDEFMYFWEDYGNQLSLELFGKKLMKSTKKFEIGDKESDEYAGLTKIDWGRDSKAMFKTLPEFKKDPDSRIWHTKEVMALDNYGNCKVGIFTKNGKNSKKVDWRYRDVMQKPMYWIDQHSLVSEIAEKMARRKK